MSDAQIKSIIERILRLKEQQDEIGADIREVYAEAKSNGFDKTALGQAVSLIRKRDKKGRDEFDEQQTIVDLYIAAYDGTLPANIDRAHTHEAPRLGDPVCEAYSDITDSLPAHGSTSSSGGGDDAATSAVSSNHCEPPPASKGKLRPEPLTAGSLSPGESDPQEVSRETKSHAGVESCPLEHHSDSDAPPSASLAAAPATPPSALPAGVAAPQHDGIPPFLDRRSRADVSSPALTGAAVSEHDSDAAAPFSGAGA